MIKDSKIYVAGHMGMVGSSVLRQLSRLGYKNILTKERKDLDLENQIETFKFLMNEKPDFIIHAAALVGGINANNTSRGDFIYKNACVNMNIIEGARRANISNLIYLGSSCIYPRDCPQPIKEEYLLTSELEKTNEPYAIAKIFGLKMCEAYNFQYNTNFISLMPTNLYGPNDNYDLETSHVFPALIRKIYEAKLRKDPFVQLYGSGKPFREFLHVDDLANACIYIMENQPDQKIINIGYGEDISIMDLANLIKKIVKYDGSFEFNSDYPDGTPKKLLDSSLIKFLGWKPTISLEEGIRLTLNDYIKNFHA